MINGFDSYKLSINNLNDVNADSVNSNSDYTTSLYINGQLIDFSSYITSSYLFVGEKYLAMPLIPFSIIFLDFLGVTSFSSSSIPEGLK